MPPPLVEAVRVTDDVEAGGKQWESLGFVLPPVVLESPQRETTAALLQFISYAKQTYTGRALVTVAIPETATRRWWHPLVRNYLGSRLKVELLSRADVSIMSVPLGVSD